MSEILIYLILSIGAIALGFFIGRLQSKVKFESINGKNSLLEENLNTLQSELKKTQTDKELLLSSNIRNESDLNNLQSKYDEDILPIYEVLLIYKK